MTRIKPYFKFFAAFCDQPNTREKGHFDISKFVSQLLTFLIFILKGFSVQANENDDKVAFWIWGNSIPEKTLSARNLYAYQGVFDVIGDREIYRFEGLSPRPIEDFAGSLILTYRLEKLVPPEMVISRFIAHRQAWRRYGVFVTGIQIDYDSPTAKLREYASWLSLLRNEVDDGVPLSITGLGDWLASARPGHLEKLSQSVSYIAFMMYHGTRPLLRLNNYKARLINLSLPFKLGRLQSQRDTKQFLGVYRAPGYIGEIIFIHSGDAL